MMTVRALLDFDSARVKDLIAFEGGLQVDVANTPLARDNIHLFNLKSIVVIRGTG